MKAYKLPMVTEKLLERVDFLSGKVITQLEKKFSCEKNQEKRDVLFDTIETVREEADSIRVAIEALLCGERMKARNFNRLNSIYSRESTELVLIRDKVNECYQR